MGGMSDKVANGTIKSIIATFVRTEDKGIWSHWNNAIEIIADGEEGDSGSLVVGKDMKVVGVVSAGPKEKGYLYASPLPFN